MCKTAYKVIPTEDLWCHGLQEKNYIYFPEYQTEIITIKNNKGIHFIYENVSKRMTCTNVFCQKGNGTLKIITYSREVALAAANPKNSNQDLNKLKTEIRLKKELENQIKAEENKRAVAKANGDLSFTIKDKKEQCEAIGFKPETEKFADCVLRLVELDVKQQTQNQKTVAQNNGNDALVKQLERQNNLQSSQALIDLGQQLMKPKQYNSNIYMPQTRRCTVSGFGVTSVVRCY